MVCILQDSSAVCMTISSSVSVLPYRSAQQVNISATQTETLGLRSSFLGHDLRRGQGLPVQSSLALICNTDELNSCKQLIFQIQGRTKHHRKDLTSNAVAQAASASDLVKRFLRCLMKTPAKIFLKQLEGEIDKAADFIEEGAEIVKGVAEGVANLAEVAEITAKEAEDLATKVDEVANRIEKDADDALSDLADTKKKVLDDVNVNKTNSNSS
ncbi:hypothetical protein O6H91_19G021800 [Diphasiastrum complanatum]|uniref:Uncharacterized protein n=1 Tax=Diphasiastrum complanatum TaxID=34168 RepID=A0ACC2ATD9_DIPCM|nr:hypothetical protein O6H91_19G021800 [Diphasiastrum complanatum]